MAYTVIKSTPEQIEKLWSKHLKPFWGVIPKNFNVEYDYDDKDDIGFVLFDTITGKEVNYQLRGKTNGYKTSSGLNSINLSN